MPIFFQHQISEATRLGIWKIEESEDFFRTTVPQHRQVTHPHKRLQHLAGRFLLQYLFPGFPYELIQIADTRKPFIPDEQYHFSISHCGDFAAAIVSQYQRVGIDIEIPVKKILNIQNKFLSVNEKKIGGLHPPHADPDLITLLWSAKESVFKWYGDGEVDFRQHIQLMGYHEGTTTIDCLFSKTGQPLTIHYRRISPLVLAWVTS
jgi:phosphopantetheinyl transferase